MSLAQMIVEGVAGGVPQPITGVVTTSPTLPETELAAVGNGAAAIITATLAAAVAKTTYLAGFHVDGLGATAGSVIDVAVTGLLGGTINRRVTVPAGAGVAIAPLVVEFSRPIPGAAVNTAIVVTVPSFGAGNTVAQVAAHGFQK